MTVHALYVLSVVLFCICISSSKGCKTGQLSKATPLNGSAYAAVHVCLDFCTSAFRNRVLLPIAATKVCTDMSQRTHAHEGDVVVHTDHADRLLVLMRIPSRKSQIDFRIYRIDFCHEALLMRIPQRKSKSTSHHPLGSYIIIKRVSRSGRSVLVRSTLYRGPVA